MYYTVCLTELWPTFDFNNSTTRPGISPQSFSPEPCEQCEWFSTVKLGQRGHMKIFLACTTFFVQFSKNPPASLFPLPIFPKFSFSIPPANFYKCSNFLISTANTTCHRHAAYYWPIENGIGIPWKFLCKCSGTQSMSHKNFMGEFQFLWDWCWHKPKKR